ncbi:MAG: hypothetical protein RIR71_640 [Actinomycetota bacterium]|jgi:hypothetical protein
MVKQINPSLARIWRSENIRQYGYSKPALVTIESEAQHRLVDILEQGVTNVQFENLSTLAKIPPAELSGILSRLSPLLRQTSSFLPELDQRDVEIRFAEIMRIFLADFSDPAAVIKNRRQAKVFLSTLGRPGLLTLRALYTAGIGTAITFDGTRVKNSDTNELGYSPMALGLTRHEAAKQILGKQRHELQLHTRLTEGLDRVNAAILMASDVINPADYQVWMTRDIPHIAICFTESGASISQLVIPGLTPCLACCEIQKMQDDPSWLSTVTQLSQLDRDLADAVSMLAAVSVAVNRVLDQIDNVQPQLSSPWDFDSKTGEIRELPLPTANCGCR